MSGDSINNLKMDKEQPLNLPDLEYTQRLIEPFEDIVVERFSAPVSASASASSVSTKRKIFVFIAIGLVLVINFPKVREQSGLNEYLLWLISAVLLLGVLY
jgi:hypothetical protein